MYSPWVTKDGSQYKKVLPGSGSGDREAVAGPMGRFAMQLYFCQREVLTHSMAHITISCSGPSKVMRLCAGRFAPIIAQSHLPFAGS